MMRHHFQSQFFWQYHLAKNAATEDNDVDTNKVDKDEADIKEMKDITNLNLVKHQKVDCAFILLAVFIVTGFTLTISSFGAQKSSLVEVFGSYDYTFQDDVSDVNLTNIFSTMVPLSYILYVYPKIPQKTFSSIIKIEFECEQELSKIAFHSSNLTIMSIALLAGNGHTIPFSHTRKGDKDATIIFLYSPLEPKVKYQLLITSDGVLSYDPSQALYLVKTQSKGGKQSDMLMTNIAKVGARKAWPCLDDPSKKATWKLIVQHHKKYQAISNMPVFNIKTLEPENLETYFEVTPLIGSSSLSLILTELEHEEMSLMNGLIIRSFAPPLQLKSNHLTVKIASLVVKYYSKKFPAVKPVKKLDILSAPSKALPTSSFGLIILDTDLVQNGRLSSSPVYIEKLAMVISKQVCNQWFSNFANQKGEAWLKDALCGYLQILPLKYYYPSWKLDSSFYMNKMEPSIRYDSNEFTESVKAAESNPLANEILKYSKPSSLIRMLAHFVGKDVLIKGLNIILGKSKSENVNLESFWKVMGEERQKRKKMKCQNRYTFKKLTMSSTIPQSFQTMFAENKPFFLKQFNPLNFRNTVVSSVDISGLMNKWIDLPGYPLLTTKRVKRGISINQKRFTFANDASDGTTWKVPIFVDICGKKSEYILKTAQGIIPVDGNCPSNASYLINNGAKGFYQVLYSSSNMLKLLHILNTDHKQISAIDRGNLLANLQSLTRFNHQNVSTLLDFTLYLQKEHDYLPWYMASKILDQIYASFSDKSLGKCVKDYTTRKMVPVLNYLASFTNHTHPQKRLISLLLKYLLMKDNKGQLQQLRLKMENRFFQWELGNGRKRLGGSIKAAILFAGVSNSGSSGWNFGLRQFQNSKSGETKNLLLSVLSSTRNTYQLRSLLNAGGDNIEVLSQVCKNVKGRAIVLSTLKTKWESLMKRYKKSEIESLISACYGSGMKAADLTRAKDLKSKFKSNTQLTFAVNRAIQDIQLNINFRRNEKEITQWFHRNDVKCSK